MINRLVVKILIIGALCGCFYLLGASRAKIKIVEKQNYELKQEKKVIENVNHKQKKIWTKPNANRDTLLKLMQNNQL